MLFEIGNLVEKCIDATLHFANVAAVRLQFVELSIQLVNRLSETVSLKRKSSIFGA